MSDELFIKRTIALAKRAEGYTSPNPMVGAVVVKNGRIISEGYHKKAGTAHAEVTAIDKAGDAARGSTLYVSLEPCCHKDKRTPPCTEKIIAAGIKRVVVSIKDPNPKVSGKGIERLKSAGIEVLAGIHEERARSLNEFYIKHITSKLPFVVLKVAMTLDGKIATPEGESKWITGEKARKEVHRLRKKVDAVLTGIGTVLADNPQLTCRIGNRSHSPVRVVVDPELKTGYNSNILNMPPQTIIVTKESAAPAKKDAMRELGAAIIEYDTERLDMRWLMKRLHEQDIISVLIEGGSSISSSCLDAGIVDKVMFFIAPKMIGGRNSYPAVGGERFRSLQDAYLIKKSSVRRLGEDFLIEGYL